MVISLTPPSFLPSFLPSIAGFLLKIADRQTESLRVCEWVNFAWKRPFSYSLAALMQFRKLNPPKERKNRKERKKERVPSWSSSFSRSVSLSPLIFFPAGFSASAARETAKVNEPAIAAPSARPQTSIGGGEKRASSQFQRKGEKTKEKPADDAVQNIALGHREHVLY